MRFSATVCFLASCFVVGTECAVQAGPTYAFPGIGNDTSGPDIIITLNANGTATITSSGQGAYDGSDDTYVGVINNSGGTVKSITLKSNTDIFNFDGDGIGSSPYNAGTNSQDTSDGNYGGPFAYFTNITGVDGPGNVNFIGGLLPGGGTFAGIGIPNGDASYFSLEDTLTSANFTVTSFAISAVPEPMSAAVFAFLGVSAAIGHRCRKKAHG